MDYSNFLMMKEELSLIAVMVILLLYDLMGKVQSRVKILMVDTVCI